nr:hypothetical protein [Natrarchaeobaculum sulfurireducens]
MDFGLVAVAHHEDVVVVAKCVNDVVVVVVILVEVNAVEVVQIIVQLIEVIFGFLDEDLEEFVIVEVSVSADVDRVATTVGVNVEFRRGVRAFVRDFVVIEHSVEVLNRHFERVIFERVVRQVATAHEVVIVFEVVRFNLEDVIILWVWNALRDSCIVIEEVQLFLEGAAVNLTAVEAVDAAEFVVVFVGDVVTIDVDVLALPDDGTIVVVGDVSIVFIQCGQGKGFRSVVLLFGEVDVVFIVVTFIDGSERDSFRSVNTLGGIRTANFSDIFDVNFIVNVFTVDVLEGDGDVRRFVVVSLDRRVSWVERDVDWTDRVLRSSCCERIIRGTGIIVVKTERDVVLHFFRFVRIGQVGNSDSYRTIAITEVNPGVQLDDELIGVTFIANDVCIVNVTIFNSFKINLVRCNAGINSGVIGRVDVFSGDCVLYIIFIGNDIVEGNLNIVANILFCRRRTRKRCGHGDNGEDHNRGKEYCTCLVTI